ncbi:MAG: endonuclease [Bacteroidota bacterium]
MASTVSAQVFPSLTGQELLDQLAVTYRPSQLLDYGDARDTMYTHIYNMNDSVSCVYTGHTLYVPPGQDPTVALFQNGNNNGINTEHTWPQSLGASEEPARNNMHHLFPTRTAVNSARANFPFADIPDEQTTMWYFQTEERTDLPTDHIDQYSERINGQFEPREDHKGNVARAMFYFYTIYQEEATSVDPTFFTDQLSALCHWHNQDPADSLELLRTFLIADYQSGLVNPFVVDCTLAGRTYCQGIPGDCPDIIQSTTADEKETGGMVIAPNPIMDRFQIEVLVEQGTLTVANSLGRIIRQQPWEQGQFIDATEWGPGIYFILLKSGKTSYVGRIVKQ